MWNDAVVTDSGMSIMAQWAGGGTLDITSAKLGGSTVPAVQLTRQTNVAGYKGDGAIIRHKDIDGGIEFTIRISPLDTAAVIKQIGLFGRLNDGEEKLIAIYQDNDGISVPSGEMPEFAYDFNATIATDKGSDITVHIDPMAFATKVELAEVSDGILALSHEVSKISSDVDEHFKWRTVPSNVTKIEDLPKGVYNVGSSSMMNFTDKPDGYDGGVCCISVYKGDSTSNENIIEVRNPRTGKIWIKKQYGTWGNWEELVRKSDLVRKLASSKVSCLYYDLVFVKSGNVVTVIYNGDSSASVAVGNIGVVGTIPEGFRPTYIDVNAFPYQLDSDKPRIQLTFKTNGTIEAYNYGSVISGRATLRFTITYITE